MSVTGIHLIFVVKLIEFDSCFNLHHEVMMHTEFGEYEGCLGVLQLKLPGCSPYLPSASELDGTLLKNMNQLFYNIANGNKIFPITIL